MSSCQVLAPAWTPAKSSALISSFQTCNLSSRRSDSCHHVTIQCSIPSLPKGGSSTNRNKKLRTQVSPALSLQPTDGLIPLVVKKLTEFKTSLQSLQSLHRMLKAQHAAQRESTYKPKWSTPWPPKLSAAYKTYKKDDDAWRPLKAHFATHCSRYGDVQPESKLFAARLRMAISLGNAATRTATGRLQFLLTYPAAFPKYKQVGTHIYEGSQAMQSVYDAVNELTLRLDMLSCI